MWKCENGFQNSQFPCFKELFFILSANFHISTLSYFHISFNGAPIQYYSYQFLL